MQHPTGHNVSGTVSALATRGLANFKSASFPPQIHGRIFFYYIFPDSYKSFPFKRLIFHHLQNRWYFIFCKRLDLAVNISARDRCLIMKQRRKNTSRSSSFYSIFLGSYRYFRFHANFRYNYRSTKCFCLVSSPMSSVPFSFFSALYTPVETLDVIHMGQH